MKIFFLIFILIILNRHVIASDLFETSFYDIEFISDNIENEKIKQINDVKRSSILNLLSKTLDKENFADVSNYLTEDFINTLIKNIIINDEKIINNKYISKIKINFDKKKIIYFFQKNKIPYIEYQPHKFLLIIYEQNGYNENLFSNNNNFYSYYKRNINENNIFKIPNLDINDRFLLKKEDLKIENINKIKKFSNKYKLDEIVVVIVNTNNNITSYHVKLYSKNHIQEKILKFNQFRIDSFFNILESETLDLWKKINYIQNASLNVINCRINYFNMLELKEIKKNLKNISIVKQFDVEAISYQNIEYKIYYYGNQKIFINLIKLNKLKINDIENSCTIRLQ